MYSNYVFLNKRFFHPQGNSANDISKLSENPAWEVEVAVWTFHVKDSTHSRFLWIEISSSDQTTNLVNISAYLRI